MKTPINIEQNDNETVHEDALKKVHVAKRFRVTTRAIDNWMKQGLPHYRIGRRAVFFRWSAIVEWIEQGCPNQHRNSKRQLQGV